MYNSFDLIYVRYGECSSALNIYYKKDININVKLSYKRLNIKMEHRQNKLYGNVPFLFQAVHIE